MHLVLPNRLPIGHDDGLVPIVRAYGYVSWYWINPWRMLRVVRFFVTRPLMRYREHAPYVVKIQNDPAIDMYINTVGAGLG